ncbi:MAG: hypothetical protein U0572_15280 [Phycisphaerales bacterium]
MAIKTVHSRPALALFAALASTLLSSGCQVLGPEAMSAGRGQYADVVARTNAEQTLGMIVRLRYNDPIVLMSVTSITASLKFSIDASGQLGAGPKSNYAGNLVPISVGAAYEDSPTISYAPVTSEAFVSDWLSPVQLETLVLAMQCSGNGRALLPILVVQMNELRSSLDGDTNPKFLQLTKLLGDLRDCGAATWGRSPSKPTDFVLTLSRAIPGHDAEIDEVLALLGLSSAPTGPTAAQIIELPLDVGVHRPGEFRVTIQTRSVAELIHSASMAIEVPPEHVAQGIVEPSSPRAEGIPPIFEVRSSASRPKRASVAVQHRGVWFYIDDADLRSKRAFQTTEMLFMMRLSEAERGSQQAPVLTVPVG